MSTTDCVEDESEWEEEEQLVVVHLSGIIDTEYLKKCDPTNCKILGIDTEEPVLQIDKMCFRGSYDDCVGTNIIFEEEEGEVMNGKVENTLKYMCHTEKNLDMVRVFFKSEEDIESGEQGGGLQRTNEDHNVATKPEGVTGGASDNCEEIEVQLEMSTHNERHTEQDDVATGVRDPDPMDCT